MTDEWKQCGVKEGKEYAILTDEITHAWAGITTRQYKQLKGLKKENLRDNMTDMELILNMLAEASTTEISKAVQPETFDESYSIASQGGEIAGNARHSIEDRTGKPVITSRNASDLSSLVTGMIDAVSGADKPENSES